jgi:hypothetical protein
MLHAAIVQEAIMPSKLPTTEKCECDMAANAASGTPQNYTPISCSKHGRQRLEATGSCNSAAASMLVYA